jgi:hypothetical protein
VPHFAARIRSALSGCTGPPPARKAIKIRRSYATAGSSPNAAATVRAVACTAATFRGHFVTKSRSYSTTLGELRAARAAYRAHQDQPPDNAEVNDDDSSAEAAIRAAREPGVRGVCALFDGTAER